MQKYLGSDLVKELCVVKMSIPIVSLLGKMLHVNAGRRKASSQVSGQVCICQEGPVGASERGPHHSKMSEKGSGFLEASMT